MARGGHGKSVAHSGQGGGPREALPQLHERFASARQAALQTGRTAALPVLAGLGLALGPRLNGRLTGRSLGRHSLSHHFPTLPRKGGTAWSLGPRQAACQAAGKDSGERSSMLGGGVSGHAGSPERGQEQSGLDALSWEKSHLRGPIPKRQPFSSRHPSLRGASHTRFPPEVEPFPRCRT